MQKNQKFKNNGIEKLRLILDNISIKDLPPEDEKYLRSLTKKLEKSSKETIAYKKGVSKKNNGKKIVSLKPKVTIHAREVKKIIEFPEVKEEKIEVQTEKPFAEPPLPAKEPQYKDEDVFEIEKVEISEPKFIEVKPKVFEKKEKEETIEKKVSTEIELTEWEPVEIVKEETEEKKIEEKKKYEVIEKFCNQCGAKLIGGVSFCPECGKEIKTDYKESKKEQPELIEKDEHLPEFIPVKKEEDKKELIVTEEEPAKLEEESAAVEVPIFEVKEILEEPSVTRESKIEIFKVLKSIDEGTAVLLYDNGYTSVEALIIASLKDLTKIEGINKKTAKKIKKEIEKKSEPKPVDIEVKATEEIIEKKVEDETSLAIEEKKDESYDIIPIVTDKTAVGEVTNEKIESKEEIIEKEVKIDAFKDMESIDNKTASLLYNNGFTTFDSLKQASLKDFTKIKGINRKQAKKIKKEIDKKIEESVKVKPIPIGETAEGIITEEQVKKDDEFVKKEEELPSPVDLSARTLKWSPITEEEVEEKEILEEPGITRESKIEIFKGLESIDEDTAVLLYNNGYTDTDFLKEASLKDLTKIKGIKRKQAKKIKKEIEQKSKLKSIKIKDEENFNEQLLKEELEKDDVGLVEEKIPEYEPVKTDDEIFEIEEVEDLKPIKVDEEEVFKNIKSIDEKIAKLLKENGIYSIESLRNATIKDLTKIRGIKKKIAKKIKKEITELSIETEDKTSEEISMPEKFERGENPFIKDEEDEWISFDEDNKPISDMTEGKGFRHGDYTLYEKEIITKSGKKRTVQFFSKGEPDEGEPIDLPKGYKIKENKKTGIPYLKKKK